MHYLLGIDDTDNLESTGTGHRARDLGIYLQQRGLGECSGITRHQLLVSPEIPYTSHNSSACLTLTGDCPAAQIAAAAGEFLLAESAAGSDAGYCLGSEEQVNAAVIAFGRRAKVEVLTQAEAVRVAAAAGLLLAGLTGTGGGVIGALAAVGLRAEANDGRFLWMPGLRELSGTYSANELYAALALDCICTLSGEPAAGSDRIGVGNWIRPILKDGRVVLYVEREGEDEHVEWHILDKDTLKKLSQ